MIANISKVRSFIKDTRGANMVEYIILVGVVAILAIAAFKAFGGKVSQKITNQGNAVGNVQDTAE
jgi:pilus assembly protein Flp/PilA